MKKKKEIKRQRVTAEVEHRLTKVEEGLVNVKKDIEEVMLNVTNHIPTSIQAVKDDLKVLLDRKHVGDVVKAFATNFLKISCGIATATWAVIQIIHAIKG